MKLYTLPGGDCSADKQDRDDTARKAGISRARKIPPS
jgi:hypothetical protein